MLFLSQVRLGLIRPRGSGKRGSFNSCTTKGLNVLIVILLSQGVVKKWAAIVRLPLAILNPLARFGGIFLQYRSFPRAKYVPHSKVTQWQTLRARMPTCRVWRPSPSKGSMSPQIRTRSRRRARGTEKGSGLAHQGLCHY
jgi:hypothetical protein